MRQKLTHSLLGMSLLAAVVAGVPASAGAQAGWQGFTATTTPTVVGGLAANDHPAWSAAVTEDLGGSGVDIWVNNHAIRSEGLIDWEGGATLSTLFDDATVSPLVNADTHGAVFIDVDGDGDDDLIEVMGRNNDNRVFRNTNGVLSLIATPTGLEDFDGRGRHGLPVDYDQDGDMDLMVGNLDRMFLPEPENMVEAPSELYLNNGDGTTWTKASDPADLLSTDSIRLLSMTSTGPGTPAVILPSNTFSFGGAPGEEVTIEVGNTAVTAAATPVRPFAFAANNMSFLRDIAIGDIDGDLEPEFVAARQDDFLGSDVDEDGTPGDLKGQLPIVTGDVSTKLTTVTTAQAVTSDWLADNCRGVTLADYDNDADLDIFGACAFAEGEQNKNVVLLNDGTGTFTVATGALETTGANTATFVVNADFNGDGWVDTYVGSGYDSQEGPDHIFLNEGGNGNHWLEIDLVSDDNPDAIGAQVFVGTDKWQVRETAHRLHQGQDMSTLHFGLGSAQSVAPLQIMWPDGSFEQCTIAGIDQRVTITQGGNGCATQTKAGFDAALDADPVQGPGPELCRGRIVTVNIADGEMPTDGDDVILGTESKDVIDTLAGNDVVCALGGDDIITGGPGLDRIYGDDGRDQISGGEGRDRIFGGAGGDTIFGGTNRDVIVGNSGRDTIYGEGGRDRINGSTGNDTVIGGGGDDQLKGGAGIDFARGGNGFDICFDAETVNGCEA